MTTPLEQRLCEAAEKNNTHELHELLNEAIETITDDTELNRILDHVLLVQEEAILDLRGWNMSGWRAEP